MVRNDSAGRWSHNVTLSPFRNHSGTHHPAQAKNDFHVVFDAQMKEARRSTVFFYVNKRVPWFRWSLAYQSQHVISIKLILVRAIFIHNAYINPIKEGDLAGLEEVRKALDQIRTVEAKAEHILVGDFNIYSSRWSPRNRTYSSHERRDLLHDILDSNGLELMLKKGTPTWDDLVVNCLLWCLARPPGEILDKGSDHSSVETLLLPYEPAEVVRRRWWRRMDKDLIRLSVGALLSQIPQTTQPSAQQSTSLAAQYFRRCKSAS